MDTPALPSAHDMAKAAKTPFPGESAQYRDARQALLAQEIEFRRQMSRLAEQAPQPAAGSCRRKGLSLSRTATAPNCA